MARQAAVATTGQLLCEVRKACGLTQGEVADCARHDSGERTILTEERARRLLRLGAVGEGAAAASRYRTRRVLMERVSLGEELLRRAVREPKRESAEARLAAEAAGLKQELGELRRGLEKAEARVVELETREALQAFLRKRARQAPRQAA